MVIYHLISRGDWEQGAVEPGPEGFIHFSYLHQWRLSLQRYLCGQPELVLLEVEPQAGWDLRVEGGFPHLYQPLPRESVRSVRVLPTYRDLRVGLLGRVNPPRELLAELAGEVDLVVLPELPFQPWAPAHPESLLEDADLEAQARLSAECSVALLAGGARQRRNRAVLFAGGDEVLNYCKMHLPQEPGFWEANYYDPGREGPQVCDALGFPLGVQLCSDIQRPFGLMHLMRQGVSAVLCPRATEAATWDRWRQTYQTQARLFSSYVLTVNRPPEAGTGLGGPSLVVGPDGEVVAESVEELTVVTLRHEAIVQARAEYPGYLDWPWEDYRL